MVMEYPQLFPSPLPSKMWFLIGTEYAKAWVQHDLLNQFSVRLAFQNGNLIMPVPMGLQILQRLPTVYWPQTPFLGREKAIQKWTPLYPYTASFPTLPFLFSAVTSPPLLSWSFTSVFLLLFSGNRTCCQDTQTAFHTEYDFFIPLPN